MAELFHYVRQAARRWNQDCIDTEHVLLGLLEEPGSEAVKLLRSMGWEPDAIRREVESRMVMGSDFVPDGQLPIAHRVKRALERARKLAERTRSREMSGAHVLYGLVTVRGNAARALTAVGAARGLHKKWGGPPRTALWIAVAVAVAIGLLFAVL